MKGTVPAVAQGLVMRLVFVGGHVGQVRGEALSRQVLGPI